MKTVQNQLMTVACLLLLTSCGDMKTVVESPKVTLDPPIAKLEQKEGADPLEEKQWALKKVAAAEAWTTAGVGVRRMRVAIISSGIDYNHEDLQSNVAFNDAENTGGDQLKPKPTDKKDSDGNGYIDDLVGWDTVDNDGFPYDLLGDGTAAAGVLGALHNNALGIKGVLGEVSIVPVRYIDSAGATSVDKLIESLRYVNSLKKKVDVVLIQVANVDFTENAGFGAEDFFGGGEVVASLSQEQTLLNELSKLESDDIPVVANAGNRRTTVEESKGVLKMLSTKKNVLLVTSVDQNDVKPEAANFSPKSVVTTAPGIAVLSTLPGNQYAEAKGSFIAAAHVAAAVTLVKTHRTGAKTDDIRKMLLVGGDDVPALSPLVLGSNRLNLAKLVTGIKQPADQ